MPAIKIPISVIAFFITAFTVGFKKGFVLVKKKIFDSIY